MLCHTCRHFYSKTELLRLSCFLRSCVSCTGIQRVEVEFMQNKVNCNALCIQISGLFSSYTSATKFCAFQTKQSLDGYYHNVINTAFVLPLMWSHIYSDYTLISSQLYFSILTQCLQLHHGCAKMSGCRVAMYWELFKHSFQSFHALCTLYYSLRVGGLV